MKQLYMKGATHYTSVLGAKGSGGDAQPDFETKSGCLPSTSLPVIFFHLFLL